MIPSNLIFLPNRENIDFIIVNFLQFQVFHEKHYVYWLVSTVEKKCFNLNQFLIFIRTFVSSFP